MSTKRLPGLPLKVSSPTSLGSPQEFLQFVLNIHSELVESLEWSISAVDMDQMQRELPPLIHQMCTSRSRQLTEQQTESVIAAVMAETFGLGPLEPLLADARISDILVNGCDEVFIERDGQLIRTDIKFADDAHVMRIIQRIASRVGRRLDESSPVVDARMEDGSRVHAIAPPLAVGGPTISIRRFGKSPLRLEQLVEYGSMHANMATFLSAAIVGRVSCLISGGTGAGKTTMLNALSANIPTDERIVTIEDVTELRLLHPHVVSLEARNANVDGKGEVSIRELVRNSLRMRPDRILVGEVRGSEAVDMLQALNTGHEGSLTTIHANDTRDALARLELMIGMSGYDFSLPVLRQYIANGVKLLVHVGRLKGGVRRVMRIAEVVSIEHGEYRLEDIFGFRQTGLDSENKAVGEFYVTGYRPQCLERIHAAGVSLDDALFGSFSLQRGLG